MSTDRKLLEQCAKAVPELGAQWDCPERGMMILTPDGIDTLTWNPLVSNSDAFQLAIWKDIFTKYTFTFNILYREEITHRPNDGAHRRAIVRTVIEIERLK